MITVVNKSTKVSDADVQTMVGAIAHQVRYHAAPRWKAQVMPVIFAASEALAPAGSFVIGILDNADQAGDLGWHTEGAGGVVYGEVFAEPVLANGGNVLTARLSVSSVLSHEVLETFCDPSANRWVSDWNGHLWALEVCDPVESDSYPITYNGVDVTVSNFVCPAWFDPQAPASSRFDWLGHVHAPFTMSPGGYVVREVEGRSTQTFGDELPDWRKKDLKHRPNGHQRAIHSQEDA